MSVLLVQTRIAPGTIHLDDALHPDRAVALDEMLERVSAATRARIEHFGGRVVGSVGPVSLGLFQDEEDGGGGTGRVGGAALRALRAAAAVRDAVVPPSRTAPRRSPADRGLTLHAAVATGEALVRFAPGDPGTPLSVNGALLDLCQRLLALVAPGEILACDDSRPAAGPEVSYGPADGSPRHWRVREVYARPGSAAAAYSAPFARPARRIGA